MFSAAIRVLSRAATIQLEEAAAAHPRPPRNILKGKERAIPIRRDFRSELEAAPVTTDLGALSKVEGVNVNKDIDEKEAKRRLGLEENFTEITDELPVDEASSTAGPSRLPLQSGKVSRSSPVASTNVRPVIAPDVGRTPIPKPVSAIETRPVETSEKSNIAPRVAPTVDKVADTHPPQPDVRPLDSSTQQMSEKQTTIDRPTEDSGPAVTDLPPIAEPPVSLAEEAEDVSLYFDHFGIGRHADEADPRHYASLKGTFI